MPSISHSMKVSGLVAAVVAAIAAIFAAVALHANTAPVAAGAPSTTFPGPASAPGPDGIALADAHAAFVAEPSAPDAWGGPRSGSEPTLSDRVVNYDIQATLDPVKHTVAGQEKLTWRNRSKVEVKSVYLHLYLNAFEGEGSTFLSEKRNFGFDFRTDVPIHDGEWGHIQLGKVAQGGMPVTWTYVHPDGGPDTDHTVVRFDLPAPVPAGASTTLDIGFDDQLPRVIARTGYFGTFHLVGQWFPKIAVLELPGERGATAPRWNAHEFHLHSEFYADYGNYDVKLTVPKGYTVGAVGEEQGAPAEANGMVTHRFVQGDVHDFAWTADSQTAPPLEGVYHGAGSPEVKVRVLYPPEYKASAAPALKATIDSLAYFSQTLGPYPYKTVTAVIPPYNAGEAGGMEYPTFFTAEGYTEVQPDTLQALALDFVTIHEFGHGYFYGILGSNEFEEPMLDEGLNDYWDLRMLRERSGTVHLATPFWKSIGIDPVVQPFEFERGAAGNFNPSDPTGANSWDRWSSVSYGTVYFRTATAMHDLEERLGKAEMEKAFKRYYALWKFRHPGIADLQAALVESTGKPEIVNAAFAQQVYATQKLDDRVDSLSSEEVLPLQGTALENGKWVETTQDQLEKKIDEQRDAWKKQHPDAKEDEGPFPWRTVVKLRRSGVAVPETLVVKFADGSSETVVWNDSKRWARYIWIKPVKAVSAEIDPQHHNYLDVSKLDDTRTVKADGSASRRWTADLAALVQTLFSMVATL
ncbi:MAG: M1 family metallopeptidase [Burkholderiaceae bacterium]|nr:M1 family metallopeptidase [Burkholderiaceae bacterium]